MFSILAGMDMSGRQVSTSGLVDTRPVCGIAGRREWSSIVKRRIVAETLVPGASVSVVARRHDINANQLFRWRRELVAEVAAGGAGQLVPVTIAPAVDAPAVSAGLIEIELPNQVRVRITGAADPAAVSAAIGALVGLDRHR